MIGRLSTRMRLSSLVRLIMKSSALRGDANDAVFPANKRWGLVPHDRGSGTPRDAVTEVTEVTEGNGTDCHRT